MVDQDKELHSLLVAAAPEAKPIYERLGKLTEFGLRLPDDDVKKLQELGERIESVVKNHPLLKNYAQVLFLGQGPYSLQDSQSASSMLLQIAVEREPNGALKWMRHVIGTKETDIRLVLEIYGVSIVEPMTFANGVRLHPMEDLKDAPNAAALLRALNANSRFGGGNVWTKPLAMFADVPKVKSVLMGDDVPDARQTSQYADILETLRGLSVPEKLAPVAKSSWQYFLDPDLARAWQARMWFAPIHEVGLDRVFPEAITSDDRVWADRYLALPLDRRKRLHVPLDRLARAKRRADAGDKAIDGAISLEALLAGGGKGEIAHKIAARTSFLLGNSETRPAIFHDVKKFYDLRSKMVHGDAGASDSQVVAERGLALCGQAIRRLIEVGSPTQVELERLDLGLWPPAATE